MSGPLISSINSGLFFYFIYVFFIPGAVIWFFRSLIVVGRPEKLSENFIIFVILSALYAGFVGWPLFSSAGLGWPLDVNALYSTDRLLFRYLVLIAYVVVVPALFGTAIGIATQRKGLTQILSSLGVPIKTPYRTGWEWVFDQVAGPVYLLIVLDDGSRIHGYFGRKSMASSDPDERDIFLEEIFDFDEHSGQWKALPERRGILIIGAAIRHIEVWNFVERLYGEADIEQS